jgi:hypothetical protein
MRAHRLALVLVLAIATSACAGRAWRSAQAEDTAAAYHRFLLELPDSRYSADAKAHLAFVRVRSKPTKRGFERFQKKYPDSPLVEELRPHVEEVFFRRARSGGSAAAYRDFLADFPDGRLAARARGNLAYLEADGFDGDADRLAAFASRYPESDFAAEAERSASALALAGRAGFDRVALVLDVPAELPGADRLRRLFSERAHANYRRAGMTLVAQGQPADAILTIRHREQRVRTQLEAGQMTQPSVVAETTLRLVASGEAQPVFEDSIEFRIPVTELGPGESALFHPRAWTAYWERDFFTPVASWNTRVAARQAKQLASQPVAVEPLGPRAALLFGTGDLQIVDLSDPASPLVLGEYRRPRDHSEFSGIAARPDGLAIFGPDGIEIVSYAPKGLSRGRVHPRDQVGSIVALVVQPEGMLSAGNRGLLWLGDDGSVKRLIDRPVLGLDRRGDRLLFTDGTSLYVSSLPLLMQGRVEAELRLGRGFRPAVVRARGSSAVVIGDPGVVWVDVSTPSRPRVVSRIDRSETGEVRDAAVVAGRVFLLGPRGLQVTDRSGERVAESVDVDARDRLGAAGRHVVLVGDGRLQVVDATPFSAARPASAAR